MRHVRNLTLAVLTLTTFGASLASAQRTPTRSQRAAASARGFWELGTDAALLLNLDADPGEVSTALTIPVGVLRAGYFYTPQLSIEPFFSLDYASFDGGASASDYTLGVGGVFHLSPARTTSVMFVRPFLAVVGGSFDPGGPGASTSDSDIMLGAGFGMKWPKLAGRFAWRGEVNLSRQFDAEQTTIGLLFGISYFTR
jgi:hypothetical protein